MISGIMRPPEMPMPFPAIFFYCSVSLFNYYFWCWLSMWCFCVYGWRLVADVLFEWFCILYMLKMTKHLGIEFVATLNQHGLCWMFYDCLNTPRHKRLWTLDLEVNDIYINILFNMQSNKVGFFFCRNPQQNIYVFILIANLFLCIRHVVFFYCDLIWATTIFHLLWTNIKALPGRYFVIKKTFLFSWTCHLVSNNFPKLFFSAALGSLFTFS